MIKIVFMGKPALSGNYTHFKYLRDNLTNCKFYLLGLGTVTDTEERDVDFVQIGQEFDRVKHKQQLAALLVDFCNERKIDILIPMNSAIAVSCIPFLKSTKIIQIINNDQPRVYKYILSHVERVSKIIAISKRQVDVVKGKLADDMKSKLILLPHGVHVDDKKISNRANQILTIGFLGRIEHASKGVFHIPVILDGLRIPFKFEIIGDGSDRDRLFSKLTKYNIPYKFRGAVPQNNVNGLISNWDILLFPSQYEGLPMTLIETMSSGVVPLANHLPGITDFIITSGKDGYVIKKNKVKDFVSRIEQLNEDRALLYRMKQAARETVRQRFELSDIIRQYQAVLEEVLKAEKPGATKDFSEWQPYVEYKPSIIQRILNRVKT
jgi:glycosyltransferase involved in cell wall biosynthesis